MYSRHTSARESERDRSPSRGSDRRTSIGHGPRSVDDASGAALNREPPRGPKALDSARGHPTASSRGRPFVTRTDYRDRERERERDRERDREREFRGRDSSFGRRDDHRSDWARRDREVSNRDGRSFQNRRSRSPSTRDRRDSRYSPPLSLEVSRSHRDAKEGSIHSSSRSQENASSWPGRGGSYRGWGRGEYDRGRGRGSFPESDTYRTRSRSREAWRERDNRDDRERYPERDSDLDRRERLDRRDIERSHDREDREKDLFPIKRERPPSRNSLTGAPNSTATTPAGNSTASSTIDKMSTKAIVDSSRRYSASTPTAVRRETERGDYFSTKQEGHSRSQSSQRAITPPPQVPAFGAPLNFASSVRKAVSTTDVEGPKAQVVPKGPSKAASTSVHPSSVIQPPTGPKAERDLVHSGVSREGHFTLSESRGKQNLPSGPSRAQVTSTTSIPAGSDISQLSPSMSGKQLSQSMTQNISRPPKTPPTGPKAGPQSSGVLIRVPTEPASPASLQFSMNRPSIPDTVTRAPPIDAPRGPKDKTPGKQLIVHQSVGQQFPNKQWISPAYQQSLLLNKLTVPSTKKHLDALATNARPSTASLGSLSISAGLPDAEYPELKKEPKPFPERSAIIQETHSADRPERTMQSKDTSRVDAISNTDAHQPSEDEVDEDEDLGLNEEDFAMSERRHQKEREALLSRRPISPLNDPRITNRLFRLQLLQILSTNNFPSTLLEVKPSAVTGNIASVQHELSPPSLDFMKREVLPFGRPLRQLKQFPGNGIPTPPMEDLPFIESKSGNPSYDPWYLDESPEGTDDAFIKKLWKMISEKREIEHVGNEECRENFRQGYKAWRMQVADLDRKRREEKPLTPAPASPPLSAAPTLAPTPIVERTRGAKNMTELDLQNILKASEYTAREEQERRDRGSNAKADPEKEAIIPNMLSETERDSTVFEDTGQLIPPREVLDIFDFVPLKDDFTGEEQKIFTDAYVAWPKKWGKIAESLPARDFQQCILHYYLTKQTYRYKELVRKNQSKRGRRAKGPTTRPKSNALMADLGVRPDVYEGDEFDATPAAVTDTGRPRRAAAPTFGETGVDAEVGSGAISRQKGVQISTKDGTDPSPDKPATRGRKTGPKTTRKPRGQQATPMPSTGLLAQKMEREAGLVTKPARGVAKVDPMPLKAAENQGSDLQKPLEMDIERSRKLPIAPAAAEGDNSLNPGFQVYQQPHQPSSYWSVYEVRDFPRLLAHFGRDFEGISTFMRTKTAIMVKNYFVRQIENGKTELEKIANMADDKKQRGEPMGPPPIPAIPPKRRYDISSSAAVQRPLAPSTDTVGIEDAINTPSKPAYSEERSPPVQHSSPPSGLLANSTRANQHTPATNRPDEGLRSQNPVQPRPNQGPRIGFFNEERRDVRQPPTVHIVPQQPGSLQLLPSQPPEKPRTENSRHQTILPQRQNIAPQPVHQSPNQFQSATAPVTQPPFPVPTTQSGVFGAATNVRNSSGQPVAQPNSVKQDPDVGHSRRQEPQPQLQPFKGSPAESPTASRPPMPIPPQKEVVNVRSNPAGTQPLASEPPRAAPAKRSNLMSLLNDEPVEPQPSKRISADHAVSAGKASSVQSPSMAFYSQQAQQLPGGQQFSRREEAPIHQPQQNPQHLSYKNPVNPIQMHPPHTIQPTENRDFRELAGFSGSPAPGPANRDWINRFDPRMSQHHTPPSGTPDPASRGQQVPLSPYPSTSAPTHQTTLMTNSISAQAASGSQYHRMAVAQPPVLPADPSPQPQSGQPGGQVYRPSSTTQQHSRMPSYGQHPSLHIHTSNVTSGHPHSAPSSAVPSMHRQPSVGYETRSGPPPQATQSFTHQQPQLQQPHSKVQQHRNMNTHTMTMHSAQQGRVGNEYQNQPGRIYTPPGQPYGVFQQQPHHRQYSQSGGEERR